MTDRELMQAVLEAMEDLHRTGDTQVFDMYAAPVLIPALRERLAQPEQQTPRPDYRDWDYQDQLDEQEKPEQSPLDRMAENARELGLDYEPVQEPECCPDTAKCLSAGVCIAKHGQEPVAVPQFRVQGCSDWYDGYPDYSDGTGAYETRTLYTSPQPAQKKPVAWMTFTAYGEEDDVWYENPEGKLLEGWTYKPLYDTTPPCREWVGLTDEEIKAMPQWFPSHETAAVMPLIRAMEAKLKELNNG